MGKPYIPGRFNTGVPCKRGHLADRLVSNGQCVECKRIGDRASNQRASKKYTLAKQYGLTLDQLYEMVERQNGKCAICSQLLDLSSTITGTTTHVDHCHASGTVRGILCNHCNRLLGAARDDVNILQRAVECLTNVTISEENKNGSF